MTLEITTQEATVVEAALRHLLDLCRRKKAVANALQHCAFDADQRTIAERDYAKFSAAERRIIGMLARLEEKSQPQLATAA